MSWTIENALEDEEINRACVLHNEYEIAIGELSIPIRIRIWRLLKGHAKFAFTQSHFIHTPVQGGPHVTSSSHADEEAYALHLAINTLLPHYKEAVAKKHEPNDAWLIPNAHF